MDIPLRDLAARLDQLPERFDDLRELIHKAIRLADSDPEMALTRVRKVLEYVARDAHERLVKEPPGTRPLENLLQRLVKDSHLPPHLAPYTAFIRELGNAGTHRGEGKYQVLDVNIALIQLGAILDWYFEAVRPDAAYPGASSGPSSLPAQTSTQSHEPTGSHARIRPSPDRSGETKETSSPTHPIRGSRGAAPAAADGPPQLPSGHLLPSGEKKTVYAPAERIEQGQGDERPSSPRRGEGALVKASRGESPKEASPLPVSALLPEPPRSRWPLIIAAAAFAFLLLGVIIYVETDKGRIRLVVNDPKAVVKIDGEVVRVEALGEPITLRAGEHALEVTWGDGQFQTRKFVVRRGDDERLRVEYEPARKREIAAVAKRPEVASNPGPARVSTAPTEITAARSIAKEKDPAPPAPPATKPGDRSVGSTAPPGSITNSIGMKLVLIPAGEFLMGSDETDPDAGDDEVAIDAAGKKAKHQVQITRPFYLGANEVTRGQFRRFVDEAGYRNNSEWQKTISEQTDEHPVVNVSWEDAVAFAAWLSRKEGQVYRLPTEAEWEYACRAGTTTRYSSGDDPAGLPAVGNIDGSGTVPVGCYNPNAWGVFDMHGNVWEWCSDGYAADYYKRSLGDDPQGPDGAVARVRRGGSWRGGPRYARSADREWYAPVSRNSDMGFRLARVQSAR